MLCSLWVSSSSAPVVFPQSDGRSMYMDRDRANFKSISATHITAPIDDAAIMTFWISNCRLLSLLLSAAMYSHFLCTCRGSPLIFPTQADVRLWLIRLGPCSVSGARWQILVAPNAKPKMLQKKCKVVGRGRALGVIFILNWKSMCPLIKRSQLCPRRLGLRTGGLRTWTKMGTASSFLL